MKHLAILISISLFCFMLLAPFVQASYLNLEAKLLQEGFVLLQGESDEELNIKGITYDQGYFYGITQELTNKEKEKWYFSFSLNKTYDYFNLNIVLPKTFKLILTSINSSGQVFLSAQNNLELSVVGENKNPSITFSYEIERKPNLKFFYYLIPLFFLLIFFLYKKFQKNKQKPSENFKRKLNLVRKTLNERENQIITLLLKNKNLTYGKLQKLSNIPKASFSRYINNLEKKGIIKRESKGRLSKISLNKEI